MRAQSFIAALICLLFVSGCTDQAELQRLQKQVSELSSENAALKSELNELKFGPSKLLAEGKKLAEQKQPQKAKQAFAQLISKHPTSPEAEEGKLQLKLVESQIAQQAAAAERAKLEEQAKQKARLANATKKMKASTDKIRGITWYKDPSSPSLAKSVQAYIGLKDTGAPWLRLRVQYYGDDWLFVRSLVFAVDGSNIEFNSVDFERDHGSGSIWEWHDTLAGKSEETLLRSIATSKSTTLRYYGQQYYDDFEIPQSQKQAISRVLDAYDALKAARSSSGA